MCPSVLNGKIDTSNVRLFSHVLLLSSCFETGSIFPKRSVHLVIMYVYTAITLGSSTKQAEIPKKGWSWLASNLTLARFVSGVKANEKHRFL